MWITSSTAKVLTPNTIALGNFDGIHRGHQQVVQPILNSGNTIDCTKIPYAQQREDNHTYATVVTFNPHPREFFTGESRKLLTPLPEKVKQLEVLGVEQLVLLPFDRELASLSPQQFVEDILVKQLRSTRISVGEDFRFGHKRAGTSKDLKAIAAKFGIEVSITSLQTCQSDRISSSLIRQALEEGNITLANQLLGRPYSLTGTVIAGQKLGRTIGFPTANLKLPESKLLPRQGVYSVEVFLEGNKEETEQTKDWQRELHHNLVFLPSLITDPKPPIKGVMNLGCRPTVDGTNPTVEVHLLDWSGDLYGQTLTVNLKQFLRPEQKFPSLEALKAQITADCKATREIIN
ncbi:MAG: bifunctional riboflavin kinase/FAD synthetase [Moorea sp. SIO2B7]|nr:bifunctional riboflavin kinase/FAD synthetase [Moorena sp. SIO2B7]